MNSTLKKVIPLVVVLLGLGGLATWDEWKTKQDETKKKEENLFYKFDVASAEKIIYTTSGEDSPSGSETPEKAPKKDSDKKPFQATISRVDNRWQISSPLQAEADAAAVEGLLKAVAEFKYEQVVSESKADWKKFGLEKPVRTVEIFPKGGSSVKVFIGINAPVGYSTYVANSLSDKVYIGSQYIGTSLAKTLQDFREKSFVKINVSDLTAFSFAKPRAETLNFKKSDNKWSADGQKDFDTDSQVVGTFIGDFNSLKAEEFLDSPDSKKLQEFKKSNLGSLTWTDQKAVKTSLYFGEIDKNIYAAFDPQIRLFKVGNDTKTKLDKNLEYFRNKKVFDFQSPNVLVMEVDGKKFKRVNESWYLEADAGKFAVDGKFSGKKGEEPKEDTSARTLLVDMEHIKADAVLKPEEAVLKKLAAAPQHKINLQMKDQSILEISGWSDPEGPDKVILKNSKSAFYYRVGKTVFSSLTKDSKPAENLSLPPMGGQGEGL